MALGEESRSLPGVRFWDGSRAIWDRLVLRRSLHVIDDEDLHWALGRFELEAELFLESGDHRGPGELSTRRVGRIGIPISLDRDIEMSLDPGLIQHRTIHKHR